MPPLTEILSIVEGEQISDYKSWKRHRQEVINKIGPQIFALSESELINTFSCWEKSILSVANIDKMKVQMNMLMAFSIFFHFQEDVDQIKNMLSIVTNLLSHKIRDVCCAAAKVLYWIAVEMTDGSILLKESIHQAFEWIDEKPKLAFNALFFLKTTKKFAPKDIVNNVLGQFSTFFNFATGDDNQLRVLAARVISTQLQNLGIQNSNLHVSVPFLASLNFISQNPTSVNSHGPLIIIKSILPSYPYLFEQSHFDKLIKAILALSQSSLDALSIDSFSLALELAKTNKFDFQQIIQTKLFANLLTKCLKSQNNNPFFQILDKYIRFFRPHDILNTLIEFVQKTLQNTSLRKLTTNGLFILSTLFELFPDAKIKPSVLTDVYPCDNYIKCLKMRAALVNYTRGYLTTVINRGLSTKAQPNAIILSLKLAQAFSLNLFEKRYKIFTQIQHLLVCQQEAI